MKGDWLELCQQALVGRGYFTGDRKILSPLTFNGTESLFSDDLDMADIGYTKAKMSMLVRLYLNEESVTVASQLWDKRRSMRKYGSVGFTTYNHLIKNDPEKKSRIASVMGPCIQAMTITYNESLKSYELDAFYRTTEVFKKFPADLVFIREALLTRFDFGDLPMTRATLHFANMTVHPMYYATLIPEQTHPVDDLKRLAQADAKMHKNVVKWTSRYLLPEHRRSIENYAQGMRVYTIAQEKVTRKAKRALAPYLENQMKEFKR